MPCVDGSELAKEILHVALLVNAAVRMHAGRGAAGSFPEDRGGLMRDLVHAPVKHRRYPLCSLREKSRSIFEEILKFLETCSGSARAAVAALTIDGLLERPRKRQMQMLGRCIYH